jgi:hypothetical protein
MRRDSLMPPPPPRVAAVSGVEQGVAGGPRRPVRAGRRRAGEGRARGRGRIGGQSSRRALTRLLLRSDTRSC